MPIYSSVKETVKEFLQIAIIALAIVLPIRYFLVQPFLVKGASMEPNFHDSEYLLIDELSYRFREPLRGEVVVIHAKESIKDFYIKRLIGFPGERVVISGGVVTIYDAEGKGVQLSESYLPQGLATNGDVTMTLAADEFFVLGDNRPSSLDSRFIGAIKRSALVGRVWIRGWPFDRLEKFEAPTYTTSN
ncbi:MAG: signal peptidase I [bacterium]|nr:signal peptidase I [bacterium]